MSAAFIAGGHAFKENFEGKPFGTVSLYPLMYKILGIQPLPNNGSLVATAGRVTASHRVIFDRP